jgi:hypothetical protein
MQSPFGDFLTQGRSVVFYGLAGHEFARMTPISLDLTADIFVKAQKAFVSQILKRHDTTRPKSQKQRYSVNRGPRKAAREGLAQVGAYSSNS